MKANRFETREWNRRNLIIGVDEVGVGAFAGPVAIGVVGYTACPPPHIVDLIRDSKKISERKRNKIYRILKREVKYHVEFIDVKKVNMWGMARVKRKGAIAAIENFIAKYGKPSLIIFDQGLRVSANGIRIIEQPKADNEFVSVASASIMAKVERDTFMIELAKKYPGYFWEQNKGYGVKAHRDAIRKIGRCPQHINAFIKPKKRK